MEITQFYVPKSNMKLKLFKNISNNFVDTKDLLELSNQRKDNPFPAGIWDCAKGNYGYCALLEFASIADYSNEEILWEMKNMYTSLEAIRDFEFKPSNIDQRCTSIDCEQRQKIVFLRLVEKWPIRSIAVKIHVDEDIINEVLSDFMDNLKQAKTRSQAYKLQQKIIRVQNDEEEIKKWVQALQDQKYTISQIRNSINRYKEVQHKVSYYRIRKTLKNIMGLTYKKATIVNKVMKQADRKRRFFEAAKIQMYLEKKNTEIIFIDESSVNARS